MYNQQPNTNNLHVYCQIFIVLCIHFISLLHVTLLCEENPIMPCALGNPQSNKLMLLKKKKFYHGIQKAVHQFSFKNVEQHFLLGSGGNQNLRPSCRRPPITVQITFIFIGQTHLVFGKRVCTCVTKHSNEFRTFLNWLKNSKRVWNERKLHILRLPIFANFDL